MLKTVLARPGGKRTVVTEIQVVLILEIIELILLVLTSITNGGNYIVGVLRSI